VRLIGKTVEQALVETAQELVAEHPEVPAGSVLRCYARAVRHVRRTGCPPAHVAGAAQAVARWRLAQRAPGGADPGVVELQSA
jgi:hypothetical protein